MWDGRALDPLAVPPAASGIENPLDPHGVVGDGGVLGPQAKGNFLVAICEVASSASILKIE